MNILDRRFRYTHSTQTNIVETWKKHGYRPTTERERAERQKRVPAAKPANVTPLRKVKA